MKEECSFVKYMVFYYLVCLFISCYMAEKRGVEAVASHLFALLSFLIGYSSFCFIEMLRTKK